MKGKTVLITGANRGIGRATSLALADLGATVVLLCRDEEKGRAVVAEIEARRGKADLIVAELSSMAQVRRAAEDFRARHDRLHVLINNAGELLPTKRITADRVEQTFAANFLGHFLLTVELLDLLKSSAPSRIVNVASEIHRRGWMRWHDLHFKADYKPLRAYAMAKLSMILFTCELARRYAGTGVTANSLHPGSVATDLDEHDGTGWTSMLARITRPFMLSPAQGAQTAVYLASSPEVERVSGRYFIKCAPARPGGYARDDGMARRIWTTSEILLGLRAADAA